MVELAQSTNGRQPGDPAFPAFPCNRRRPAAPWPRESADRGPRPVSSSAREAQGLLPHDVDQLGRVLQVLQVDAFQRRRPPVDPRVRPKVLMAASLHRDPRCGQVAVVVSNLMYTSWSCCEPPDTLGSEEPVSPGPLAPSLVSFKIFTGVSWTKRSWNLKSLLVTCSIRPAQPESNASGASSPNHRQRRVRPVRFCPCCTGALPFSAAVCATAAWEPQLPTPACRTLAGPATANLNQLGRLL